MKHQSPDIGAALTSAKDFCLETALLAAVKLAISFYK
jgi:hypothetical protein